MKTWLAEPSSGRALLHLICLLCDGHMRWHWAGMKRELQKITPLRRAELPTAL